MKNLSIKIKFLFLSSMVVLMTLIMGITAEIKSEAILSDYDKSTSIAKNHEKLLNIVAESLQIGQALRNIYIDSDDATAIGNLGNAIEHLQTLMDELQKEDLPIYQSLQKDYGTFLENTQNLYKQSLSGHPLERQQLLGNTETWRSFKKLLLQNTSEQTLAAHQSEEAFLALIQSTKSQMIFIQILALAIIMMIFYLVNHQIIRSVKMTRDGLIHFFDYLNGKTKSAEPIALDGEDELAQMAKTIDVNIKEIQNGLVKDEIMIQNTLNVAQRIKEGYLDDKLMATPSNPQLLELQIAFNDMLESLSKDINAVLHTIRSYTQNDFTGRIEDRGLKGEMEFLLAGVNSLGEAMDKTLAQNFENGLNLKHQAMILKNFVAQLSHASNEQAASLEETSAALEEITSNIGSNTEKAATMAIRANEARNATQEGEQLATQTVRSMEEIVESTNSINEAVAIIENIAFQTNILSLNAAVEAATAGEAGKGFAVVAQEVRSLANKSAEAAKTIKQLTHEAKNKAHNGSEISGKMIEGFRKIAHRINETTDLVNDVAYANKEQMHGIEQINDAIVQLDQMTQENADMSNDTDAISAQVSALAQSLSDDAMQKRFTNKETIHRSYQQRENETSFHATKRAQPHKLLLHRPVTQKSLKNPQSSLPKRIDAHEEWESF